MSEYNFQVTRLTGTTMRAINAARHTCTGVVYKGIRNSNVAWHQNLVVVFVDGDSLKGPTLAGTWSIFTGILSKIWSIHVRYIVSFSYILYWLSNSKLQKCKTFFFLWYWRRPGISFHSTFRQKKTLVNYTKTVLLLKLFDSIAQKKWVTLFIGWLGFVR